MNSKEVEIVFRMRHMRGLKKRRNRSQVLALRQAGFQFDLIANKMLDKGCGEDKLNILRMVLNEMTRDESQNSPNLRNVKRSRLKKVVSEINEVLGFTDTCSISETNRLSIAGANEVATQ